MTAAVMALYSAADQISDFTRQMRDNETSLRQLTAGLTERQFHHRPENGGWSIAQCIEHLDLTGRAFLPLWDDAIAHAHAYGTYSDDAYYPGWFDHWMLRQAEPPSKFKTKTARPFEPSAIKPRRAVIESYLNMHTEVDSRLVRLAGVDLARAKVKSPFVGWMSYSLGFSFLLLGAHERRHIWQATRVRAGVASANESPITIS